jgi:hypothetical protein
VEINWWISFFDLVRTGKTLQSQILSQQKRVIPIEEIQFAGGNWAQNPGY